MHFLHVRRLLLVLAIAGASIAVAQPSTEGNVLRVALSGEYMPLHGFKDGVATGFEAELAQRLAQRLGATAVFVDTRREFGKGSVEAVASGEVDIALNSITPTPEREKLVAFTSPYLLMRYRLAARSETVVGSLGQVRGRVAGTALALRAVETALPSARRLPAPSTAAALKMLLAGKADFVADEEVGLAIAIQQTPLKLVGAPFGESPLAIAVPKGEARRYERALEPLWPELERLKKESGLSSTYELSVFVKQDKHARVEALLSAGVDPNTPDEDGRSLLRGVLGANRIAMALLLMKGGASPPSPGEVNEGERKGLYTLFVAAAGEGNLPAVRQLLAAGVKANVKADTGSNHTALMLASAHDHREMVQLLLGNGPGIEIRDFEGKTALAHAVRGGRAAIVDALLKAGANARTLDTAGRSPLHGAVEPDSVELLLSAGAELDARDKSSSTPLLSALQRKKPEVAKVLLRHKADVRTASSDGTTALHAAARFSTELSSLLLEAGAPLDASDSWGKTPLTEALEAGNLEVVELLLARGSQPNIQTLWQAVNCQHEKCKPLPALFVKSGVDINAVLEVSRGNTALHLASGRMPPAVTETLLALGADPNRKNTAGIMPLQIAVKENPRAAWLLVDRGAQLDVLDTYGWTPLMVALWAEEFGLARRMVEAGADLSLRYPSNGENHPLPFVTLLARRFPQPGALGDLSSLLCTWTNRTQGVPLLEEPSADARVVATLPFMTELTPQRKRGAPVEVEGARGRWTQVTWEGKTGWILDAFLSARKDLPTRGLEYLAGFPTTWNLLRKSGRSYTYLHGCTGEAFFGIELSLASDESRGVRPQLIIFGGPDSSFYRITDVRRPSKNTLELTLSMGSDVFTIDYQRINDAVGFWSGRIFEGPWVQEGGMYLADHARLSRFDEVCEQVED
ncbi:ankyrin repeat domain-containing protein [Archangium lipolyticum]|uniref:ankyrin repeat domain-containing protein n=1 Tax=Archangium lipolyticum TaxID=2970465 RepID=UPI002149EAEF|nr:ankyrin repeat domain-containing protein [Archangium lipolyticum]